MVMLGHPLLSFDSMAGSTPWVLYEQVGGNLGGHSRHLSCLPAPRGVYTSIGL